MSNKDANGAVNFGRAMRSQFFLEEGFTPLNHGSFGTYPKDVRDALREFQDRAETLPDRWIVKEVAKELAKAKISVSPILNVDPNDIAFVQNSTTALNAILKSLRYESGDKLLFLSTVYSAIRELLYFIRDTSDGKVELIEIEVTYPITDDELLLKISKKIEEEAQKHNSRIKLAIVDAISSLPGVILPLQRIVKLLRSNNILSVIDGAHAIGQIHINLKELDPDFFATNCHKWLYSVRGCAVLYVPARHQHLIHHPITGTYYRHSFPNEFLWVGAQDFSSYLTVTAALEFRRKIGGEEKIREYCNKLAIEGGERIASILGTDIIGPKYVIGSMVNIRLPILVSDPRFNEKKFNELLFEKYKCSLYVFKQGGWWYVRASAQIYTDMEDFERVGYALKEICAPYRNSSKL